MTKIIDWQESSPCDQFGTATTDYTCIYPILNAKGKSVLKAAGDANYQTVKSLRCDKLRTYKDELHTIMDTWRRVYGPFPWNDLAKKYNGGDLKVVPEIEKLRNTVDLKVSSTRSHKTLTKQTTFVNISIQTGILQKEILN